MEKLWLKEDDISQLTSFSGNIDSDNLAPYIYIAQTTDMKRVLGLELYNKINNDKQNGIPLVGNYALIFNGFLVQMLTYYSCAKYIAFGGYKIANAGIFKMSTENGTPIDYKETEILIGRMTQLAASVENDFYEYIKTIDVPEYPKTKQNDDLLIIGWF